ncbi:MAG: hypothetical protein WAO83_05075 [Fuerstiella sp.]|jgi:uncharacterized protein
MATDTSLAYQHLHELLQQMADAENMLAHGPRRIAAAEKKIAAAEQECVAQKEQIQKLKRATDEASLNLKTREAAVQKHKLRLNEAGSNKEYAIIQGQINTETLACAELEDEVLAMLADVDAAETVLTELQQAVADLKQKLAEIKAEVAEREPGLNADVARLNDEIKAAEKVIPPGEAMGAYKRLKASEGATAMAKVEDAYCTECNTLSTSQDVVRLNLGEFVQCRACGRIQYTVASEAD